MDPLDILIVDDDPSLAHMLRLMLRKEAPVFSVAAVESGRDCLDYLSGQHVDCVLCDYQMPGMSGMELLQMLRDQGDDIPFIFITGQGNENVAREAFTNGASDYFTKDWGFASFTKIVNSIEKAVRHRQIERSHLACETALRESEERHLAFIANSTEGILRYEGDVPVSTSLPEDEQIEQFLRHAYLAECNDAGARMYGFEKAEDMIGVRLSDVLVGTDPRNMELLRAFIRSGYRLEGAVSHNRDKDGGSRYIMNSFTGVVQDGFLVRAWGVDRDITELKTMEEALKRSEARYRSFVSNSSEAIWCVELDEGIPTSLTADEQVELIYRHAYLAECNEAGARLLDAEKAEDVIGMRLRDIEPQGDPLNVEHIVRFVRSGYRLVRDPAHITDVKGKTFNARGSATGVVENGLLVRAWGVTSKDG